MEVYIPFIDLGRIPTEAEQFIIRGQVAGQPEEVFTDLTAQQEHLHGIILQHEDTGVLQAYKAGTEVVQQQVRIIRGQEITPELIRNIMRMHNGDIPQLQMAVSGHNPGMLLQDAARQLVTKLREVKKG